MSFGAARTIAQYMGRDYNVLILDLSNVPLVGMTACLTIESEIKNARLRQQGEIFIVGTKNRVKERLRRFQIQATLPARNFLPSCHEALKAALVLLNMNTSDRVLVGASQGTSGHKQ